MEPNHTFKLFGVVITPNLESKPPLPPTTEIQDSGFNVSVEPSQSIMTFNNRRRRVVSLQPKTKNKPRRKTNQDSSFKLFGVLINKPDTPAAAKMPRKKRSSLVAPNPCVLPPRYRDLAVEEGADEGTLKLILCKRLHTTDVSPNHGRLSMPSKQIKNGNFLNPQEEDFINGAQQGKKNKIKVMVLDPSGNKRTMNLVKWNFNASDDEGKKKKSWWFALNSDWNKLVKENRLCEEDSIQVWSFRNINGDLGFIMHKHEVDSGCNSDDDRASKRRKESDSSCC